MPDIILSTLNAKYIHCAFGLRYLLANLGQLKSRASLVEFDINRRPTDIVEELLRSDPKIIGFGVYIWNVAQTTIVIAALKRVRPGITIIIGGPEVSFETGDQEIVRLADHVITGEADLKFNEVCEQLLGERPSLQKVIHAELPDLAVLAMPYDRYTVEDIDHRVIYVEASRGCPFTCEFCLSSLDIPVRQFPLDPLCLQLQRLLDRGAMQFKFVDRTFNLNLATSRAILEFFLDRYRPGLFVHFEMIPDRLPESLREIIARFPKGALQFEVGIQSLNPDVCELISRRQNVERLADNLRFLRARTGVYIHADLIAGLPGESVDSFATGFDRLVALQPHEIQVGILKRLRGTPIVRHDAEWQMVYSPNPPYEILQTRLIDFMTMQRLRRFARHWDLVTNSGHFVETAPLLWSSADCTPFSGFMRWSEWLFAHVGHHQGIALDRLAAFLFEFLTKELALPTESVASGLWRDYQRGGRKDAPQFLRSHLAEHELRRVSFSRVAGLKRQARRLAHQEVHLPAKDLAPKAGLRG